jgi:phosphatidylglycerol:prolipoprotein diacylglycerol transferase
MLLRCYPKVTDWIFHVFNESPAADYRFLPIYSYGFWVAVGFFAAASLAVAEMRRREKLNLLTGVEKEITVGEGPSMAETAFYFIFAFLLCFKFFGFIAYQPELSTYKLLLKDYILSLHGSWAAGILGGLGMAGYYYYNQNKEKLPTPEKKKIMVYPSDSIGDLLMIALIFGVLGSALFNYLENPADYNDFWQNPVASLFSGLSVYGGLICAGIGFAVYARIKKFNLPHFLDCICPGFMLANGIGRLGCQTAGDGDWGIINIHTKPSWLPQFLWSSQYRNNILDLDPGNVISGCREMHCHYLSNPVYPTPLYEFLMCVAVFAILWMLRKRLTYQPFLLFCTFMMLIGIQRYSIEQLRDLSGRDLYHIFGMAFRQSEIISIVLFLTGLIGAVYLSRYYKKKASQA